MVSFGPVRVELSPIPIDYKKPLVCVTCWPQLPAPSFQCTTLTQKNKMQTTYTTHISTYTTPLLEKVKNMSFRFFVCLRFLKTVFYFLKSENLLREPGVGLMLVVSHDPVHRLHSFVHYCSITTTRVTTIRILEAGTTDFIPGRA